MASQLHASRDFDPDSKGIKALEELPYLIYDRFRVRCDIIVKSNGSTRATGQLIVVPLSDMHQHIGNLLSLQEGIDVTFKVDGETVIYVYYIVRLVHVYR
jgi:speckle-type POZ protein